MKRISKLLTLAILSGLFLNSCSSDDDIIDPVEPAPQGAYTDGFFVLNEGSFGNSNSSISFASNDFTTTEIEIFSKVNNESLGDTGQSLTFDDRKAFIVMNASNIIQVVDRYTFEHIFTIETGLANPREVVVDQAKIYVTNWGDASDASDDYVAIFDLETYEANGNISVGEGPEMIVAGNNKLYVALKGGYNFNNIVEVIDPISKTVETSIEVGDVPNSLQIENGYLWVMSGGIPAWPENIEETAGRISKINLSSNEVTEEMIFPNVTDHPSNFEIENNNAYYVLSKAVYSFEKSATDLPEESLFNFSDITSFYGFEVEDEYFYTGDAGNYSSNGTVRIYNLGGDLVAEFDSGGINPNGFYFND